MSELAVVGFPDMHRAAQVVNELQRIDPGWANDLARAVTVSRRDDGRLLVQQTVDPAAADSAAWSGLWASLIRETLMVPNTDGLTAASRAARTALTGADPDPAEPAPALLPPSWWVEQLGIPEEFMRDVGALVDPGHSAIFMMVRTQEPTHAAQQLRRLGGTVLRCPLDEAQEAGIRTALATGRC